MFVDDFANQLGSIHFHLSTKENLMNLLKFITLAGKFQLIH
jgi:hypothetical protein